MTVDAEIWSVPCLIINPFSSHFFNQLVAVDFISGMDNRYKIRNLNYNAYTVKKGCLSLMGVHMDVYILHLGVFPAGVLKRPGPLRGAS